MKNPFKRKGFATKPVKVPTPKSNINFPFSQPGNQSDNNNFQKSSEDKKTRIGRQPDMPFGAKKGNDNLSCPKCQYPLRIEPSGSSPCPNCGFMGTAGLHDTLSDSKKTEAINNLNFQNEQELSSFRFKMISESSGSELKIESEENEMVLNRDHLDPNNNSISSKEHVLVRFRDGKIFFQDVSTNGSTFIQVINKMLINPGIRIVLGNKVFLFSSGQTMQAADSSKATRQINDVNLDKNTNNDFVLIEETSRRKIPLIQGVNLLNRNNLDPGNASISGNKHAILDFIDGKWYLSDLSSNAATFIQCKTEQKMADKTRVIIGNIIFRFECY
jgi:uncharacterized Zn finger protein (UPF0148 family)